MSPVPGVLVDNSKSQKSYSYLYTIMPAASLICLVLFFSSSSFSQGYTERISSWRDGTQSQNGFTQSQNIVTENQDMITQSQNDDSQNQHMVSHSQNDFFQSENMVTQSQNMDTQNQYMITQSQNIDTQNQDMVAQSQNDFIQSQNIVTQNQDVDTQSQNVDTQNQYMVDQSQNEDTKCKNQCRPNGSEALPAGIVSSTSNFEMRHLWDPHVPRKVRRPSAGARNPEVDVNGTNILFAMAVGIKQKDLVNKMVQKFLASGSVVMLLHYDGIVDKWNEFEWNDRIIHVSAISQTKWWLAKRFLHPDIVAAYDYIFLWDEDLGVDHFNPEKYVSIIKKEGLEISQPALDTSKSEVHHQITARSRRRGKVHRRTYKASNDGAGCDDSSTKPPCTGWIEMMAPVFSRAAWRCVWYMIQNDLIHAWGLDMQLGYCAQGDRTRNVGVVDAEYIVHYNHPTLGGVDETTVSSQQKDHRVDVRRLSYRELDIFQKRWQKAVEEDQCWVDPFQ